jgi:hypothetical protein
MAGTTPAKKAAPRKRATTAKPAEQIVPGVPAGTETAAEDEAFDGFDLDHLDKKSVLPDVTDQVFQFLLDGHVYQMRDPRDVDWKSVLDGVSNPILFMRLALNDPDASDRFMKAELPGWKLSALFDRWQEHYNVKGLTDLNQLLSGRPGPMDPAIG